MTTATQPTAPTHDLLTVAEFAQRFKTTVNTTRRLIQEGNLKAFRLGRVYRIPASEVDRLFSAAR